MIRPRHWLTALVLLGLAVLIVKAMQAAEPCPSDDSPDWQMVAEGLAQEHDFIQRGTHPTEREVCAYIRGYGK